MDQNAEYQAFCAELARLREIIDFEVVTLEILGFIGAVIFVITLLRVKPVDFGARARLVIPAFVFAGIAATIRASVNRTILGCGNSDVLSIHLIEVALTWILAGMVVLMFVPYFVLVRSIKKMLQNAP